jgi:hypothetical protein
MDRYIRAFPNLDEFAGRRHYDPDDPQLADRARDDVRQVAYVFSDPLDLAISRDKRRDSRHNRGEPRNDVGLEIGELAHPS